MAKSAGHIGVARRKCKSSNGMIERRSQPSVKTVAGLALRFRKPCRVGFVRWIGSVLIVRHMARLARRGESQIISHCAICMALAALHHGVRAQQRKPVKVLLNRLIGNLPAKGRVALGAIGAKLPAMDVGVATGAILGDVGEYRLGVAARAGHFFVHAAQRVSRGVMIEFWKGANRSPVGVRVAILASNVQGTVRTSFRLLLRGHCTDSGENQNEECQKPANL